MLVGQRLENSYENSEEKPARHDTAMESLCHGTLDFAVSMVKEYSLMAYIVHTWVVKYSWKNTLQGTTVICCLGMQYMYYAVHAMHPYCTTVRTKILRRPLAAEVEVVKVRATLSHFFEMLIMLLLVLPSILFLLSFSHNGSDNKRKPVWGHVSRMICMEIVGKTKYQTRGLEGLKVSRTQQALAANEAVKIDRLDNAHRAARGGTAKWVQPVLFSSFFFSVVVNGSRSLSPSASVKVTSLSQHCKSRLSKKKEGLRYYEYP